MDNSELFSPLNSTEEKKDLNDIIHHVQEIIAKMILDKTPQSEIIGFINKEYQIPIDLATVIYSDVKKGINTAQLHDAKMNLIKGIVLVGIGATLLWFHIGDLFWGVILFGAFLLFKAIRTYSMIHFPPSS